MMKKQLNHVLVPVRAALVATTLTITMNTGTPAHAAPLTLMSVQEPSRTAVSPAKSQAATDYLVHMGDHIMWKSQVGKMHPETAGRSGRDYPVQVGKHTMQKSQVSKMHPELANKEKSPADKPVAGDYPVQVGKHTMQKSGVGAMHPELVKKGKSLSEGPANDFLVQVGGASVLASALRRVDGPNVTRTALLDAGATDYRVRFGERTVWASEISAPYASGPRKGQKQPLYLVVPL